MSFISVFDVMGPNMIGPSSSHTAGAARISYLAQKMIEGPLKRADFILYISCEGMVSCNRNGFGQPLE